MEVCEANGITLNPRKFKFARKEVNFLGYTLKWDSFHPSEETLCAIENFPMPSTPSITDIRAWYGLINQISLFMATSKIMDPFRDLLKPSNATGKMVYWDEKLQDVFEKSKDHILMEACKGLAYFVLSPGTISYQFE